MITLEQVVEFINENRHLRGDIIDQTKGKRGRPALPEHLKKQKPAGNGKRGRPVNMDKLEAQIEALKAKKEKVLAEQNEEVEVFSA